MDDCALRDCPDARVADGEDLLGAVMLANEMDLLFAGLGFSWGECQFFLPVHRLDYIDMDQSIDIFHGKGNK